MAEPEKREPFPRQHEEGADGPFRELSSGIDEANREADRMSGYEPNDPVLRAMRRVIFTMRVQA